MKSATLLLLATLLPATPLLAGDPPAPAAPAPEADAFGDQKWFGAPYMRFGRKSSDTELPGYAVGSISYTHQFSSDFKDIPGDVSSGSISAWAPLLPINHRNFHLLAFGLYKATSFESNGANLLTDDTLYSFKMPILFLHDISEQWIWGGMVMPGYSGNSWSSENWSFSTALGVGYAFNEQFLLFGGAYYSYSTHDHFVTPGLAFIWRPTDRWEVSVLPPIGGISYNINENWIIGLYGAYSSGGWFVQADSFGQERDIKLRKLRLGVKAEYHIGSLFWAGVTGGYAVAQQLDIEDINNNQLLKEDLEPSPFVEASLNLRF